MSSGSRGNTQLSRLEGSSPSSVKGGVRISDRPRGSLLKYLGLPSLEIGLMTLLSILSPLCCDADLNMLLNISSAILLLRLCPGLFPLQFPVLLVSIEGGCLRRLMLLCGGVDEVEFVIVEVEALRDWNCDSIWSVLPRIGEVGRLIISNN